MHGVADAAPKNVIGRPADRGSASRDLRVDLQPSATESTSEVGQHDVSVSLACFDSEPGSIPVGASGDRSGMGACRLLGACYFIFAS